MIYESTFSDIIGIISFYSVLTVVGPDTGESVYIEVFTNLVLTVIFSVIISYILIYILQNIKGHVKLFLLIAILLLLYAVGGVFHFPSLIIILVFGFFRSQTKIISKSLFNCIRIQISIFPKTQILYYFEFEFKTIYYDKYKQIN